MRRIGSALAAGAAAAGALTACTGTDGRDSAKNDTAAPQASQSGTPAESKAPVASKDVRIVKAGVEDHEVWGPKSYVVHYEITNHGQTAADYFAQLEFLDKDGDVLGTTGVTADKLGPSKTHKGDSAPLDTEITNGAMKDIETVRVSQVDRT